MLIAFCIIGANAFATGEECQNYDVLPPCEHEASFNCYWDASTRGNHMGQSFIDVEGYIYTWNGSVSK